MVKYIAKPNLNNNIGLKTFSLESDAIQYLEEYTGYVLDAVTQPLDQNQLDAMVAWTYNLGPTNLRSSTLLRVLNEGKMQEVPQQMRRWNKAKGKVLPGLERRRLAESMLFEGDPNWHEV